MRSQATGGTHKQGYKKLKSESAGGKKLRPESMGKSKASGSLRGNAGRKISKKK